MNIKLTEREESLKDYTKTAEELILFFSNVVKSLNIAEDTYITNRVSDNVIGPVIRTLIQVF